MKTKVSSFQGKLWNEKRVNSGKPRTGNPEPSFHRKPMIEGAETRHSPPKTEMLW